MRYFCVHRLVREVIEVLAAKRAGVTPFYCSTDLT